jgi:hypothetical protein
MPELHPRRCLRFGVSDGAYSVHMERKLASQLEVRLFITASSWRHVRFNALGYIFVRLSLRCLGDCGTHLIDTTLCDPDVRLATMPVPHP